MMPFGTTDPFNPAFVPYALAGATTPMPVSTTPATPLGPAPAPPTRVTYEWAPTLAETPVTKITFANFVRSTSLAKIKIDWATSRPTPEGTIKISIDQYDVLDTIMKNNYMAQNLYQPVTSIFLNAEGRRWPPLVLAARDISSLRLIGAPQNFTAANVFAINFKGATPHWGLPTNIKRIDSTTWEFKIWQPEKRAQILRHPSFTESATIVPGPPPHTGIDRYAVWVRNNAPAERETADIKWIFDNHRPLMAPKYAAVAQWIEHPSTFAKQIWLVCFDFVDHTDFHLQNRNWIWNASQAIGWNLAMNAVTANPNIRGPGPNPNKNNNNTNNNNNNNNNNRPRTGNNAKPPTSNNAKKGEKSGRGGKRKKDK
jgi:hypothetical protein